MHNTAYILGQQDNSTLISREQKRYLDRRLLIYSNYCFEPDVRTEEHCTKEHTNVNKWNSIDTVTNSLTYVINKSY